MTANLKLLDEGAEHFLLRLLPADKGRVGGFSDKIEFASPFSSDRDMLIASLRDLDFGNPTRLYDAIATSLDELKGIEGRRVVLVFTDGDDTSSRTGFGTVLDRARAEEVMLYSIGLESNYFTGVAQVRSRPDRNLRRLADEILKLSGRSPESVRYRAGHATSIEEGRDPDPATDPSLRTPLRGHEGERAIREGRRDLDHLQDRRQR